MDSISCKFPICFTWLQNELEEKMQYWELLTEKWEAFTPCGTTACEATIGNEGKVSFSVTSLRIQKANRRKETTCSENIIDRRGFLPSGSDSSLVTAREEPSPC